MSKERDLKQRHSQEYEQMTAEELAAVLREDAEAVPGSVLEDETLLYVMRLYAQRQKKKPAKTAQEAFADFRRDYLPRVNEPSVWMKETRLPKPAVKLKRWLPLTAAAAALALVLGVGTLARPQLSKCGKPVYWQSRDYLMVGGNYNAAAARNILEFTKRRFPQWLPEGYELTGTIRDTQNGGVVYTYGSDTDERLIITFQARGESNVSRFCKNPGPSETLVHDGVVFHLFSNMEHNCAVGCVDGVVIAVTAKVSQEEIIRIIESMQLR